MSLLVRLARLAAGTNHVYRIIVTVLLIGNIVAKGVRSSQKHVKQ